VVLKFFAEEPRPVCAVQFWFCDFCGFGAAIRNDHRRHRWKPQTEFLFSSFRLSWFENPERPNATVFDGSGFILVPRPTSSDVGYLNRVVSDDSGGLAKAGTQISETSQLSKLRNFATIQNFHFIHIFHFSRNAVHIGLKSEENEQRRAVHRES